jgi:hypothetical protein
VWKLKAIEAFRFLWKGFLKPALRHHPGIEGKKNCQAIFKRIEVPMLKGLFLQAFVISL